MALRILVLIIFVNATVKLFCNKQQFVLTYLYIYLDVENQRLNMNIGTIPAYTNNPFGLLINIDYFTCASVWGR